MTRCSYIPPDGQSVIAIAQERGGTTDGDIQALRDRFGCKAEARWLATEEDGEEGDVFSCADHLGHLLDERWWWSVRPLRIPGPADITISIVNTAGVARDGFGSPMILSGVPLHTVEAVVRGGDVPPPAGMTFTPITISTKTVGMARPRVVDLGTNPTREQLEAAWFSAESAEYRAAQAAFDGPLNLTLSPLPPDDRIEKVPCQADDELGASTPAPNSAAKRNATACLDSAVDRAMIGLMARHENIPYRDDGYRKVRAAIAKTLGVHWDTVEVDARPLGFAVRWNGVGALWPKATNAAAGLILAPAPASVELRPANRPTDADTTCPPAYGGRHIHTYLQGAERCFCGSTCPPPYAVGDAVEWRTGPLDEHWHPGSVTSIVDDRPNDGIDKPFWIVRVDTAGERRFASAAVIAMCLRPAGASQRTHIVATVEI